MLRFVNLILGDRIIAVNGKNLETASHDEAVQTLQTSGNKAVIVLARTAPNASILGRRPFARTLLIFFQIQEKC